MGFLFAGKNYKARWAVMFYPGILTLPGTVGRGFDGTWKFVKRKFPESFLNGMEAAAYKPY